MGRDTSGLRKKVGRDCNPKIIENYTKIKKNYLLIQELQLKSIIYAHMLAYVRFFLYLCKLKYFTYD